MQVAVLAGVACVLLLVLELLVLVLAEMLLVLLKLQGEREARLVGADDLALQEVAVVRGRCVAVRERVAGVVVLKLAVAGVEVHEVDGVVVVGVRGGVVVVGRGEVVRVERVEGAL